MEKKQEKCTNPRYIAYAKANGKTVEAMMEHDQTQWPGGVMTGFMVWIGQQKRLFYKAHPECFLDKGWTIYDHAAWTAWLEAAANLAQAAHTEKTSEEANLFPRPAYPHRHRQ